MSSLSRQQLESWLTNIDVKGNVLDIGGGQKSLEGRVKSLIPDKYIVLDIEDKDNVDYTLDICKPISNLMIEEMKGSPYDQVFCLEVSEYFYDPINAIKNMFYLLKENGELYISFHFVYPLHKPEGADMLRYTRNWIEKVFMMVGFTILAITDRMATSGEDELGTFYAKEKMKAYKELEVIGYLVRAIK